MSIRFRCRNCQQTLSISSKKAGTAVACPKCGTSLRVPDVSPESATLADPFPREAIGLPLPTGAGGPPSEVLPRVGEIGPDPPQLLSRPATPRPPEPRRGPATGDFVVEEENSFQFSRAQTEVDEMDLTPMVDVTFLLLIFFMITASFSMQKTIEVPSPDQEKKGAAQSQMTLEDLLDSSIKIDVDAQNKILVDDEPLGHVTELADKLREKMRSEQKTEVVLRVDSAAIWETTIAVTDACNAVGMQKIRLASVAAP